MPVYSAYTSVGKQFKGKNTNDLQPEIFKIVVFLVHLSDRGSQHASSEYIKALVENGIAISMSRKGTPQDNAYAESFMKTLKYEEVYMTEYANIAEARHQIAHFLEEIYNKQGSIQPSATCRPLNMNLSVILRRRLHLNYLFQKRAQAHN